MKRQTRGMQAGRPGGLMKLLQKEHLFTPGSPQLAVVRSAPDRIEAVRGTPRPTYGVSITLFGGAEHDNVPMVTPYLNGRYGDHFVPEPGSVCLVGFVGGMRQPYIIGFIHLLTTDRTFGGGKRGRPPLAPGDRMWTSPGQGGTKGTASRALMRSGFILDQASVSCKRIYDPTLEQILDFCRDHQVIVAGGSQVWTESPTKARETLFRRVVFQRAKGSPSGQGAFVDTQEGSVQLTAPGGSPLDKPCLYCKDVNGKAREEVDEDGNVLLYNAGDVQVDVNRNGYSPAKATGNVSDLAAPLTGKDMTITVDGLFTYTLSIYTTSLRIQAIANEINDNCPEVLASIDTDGFLVVQTRSQGPDASLSISGEAAEELGVDGSFQGSGSSSSDSQDVDLDVTGNVTADIGDETSSQREVRLKFAKDGTITIDTGEGDAKAVISGPDKKITISTKGGDAQVVIDGDADEVRVETTGASATLDGASGQIELETGASKATMKTDGTVEIEASVETKVTSPLIKLGNGDLSESLVLLNKAILALNLRFAELSTHRHDVIDIGAVSDSKGTAGPVIPAGGGLVITTVPLTQLDLNPAFAKINVDSA